jgi:hypothetical protein
MTKVDGFDAMVFCGPAKAKVRTGGKAFTITRGACTRGSTWLTIILGTNVDDPGNLTNHGFASFLLEVGRTPGTHSGPAASRDGTYNRGSVIIFWHRKGYFLGGSLEASAGSTVTVTLKRNRTAGKFSGHEIDGTKVSGSFTC